MSFELSDDITENYNVTYYATDKKGGGLTIQAVASVREGKCELKGMTQMPTLIYVTQRNSKLPLLIYASRGDKIKITGKGKEPLKWRVEGGGNFNNSLTIWREKNEKLLENYVPDSVNMAVSGFVEENPHDPISSILMLNYYNRGENEEQYNSLMAGLKGEARNQKWLNISARSDQLTHYYSLPARLESMVMRSINNKKDTLIIDNKNPLLLYIWQTGDKSRKEIIDSLRQLEKDFPDSLRLVADICADIDSLAWRNAIRRDSLDDNIKRFWAPMGLQDFTIMKFKVQSLPYFIVFDKDGLQKYRGENFDEAIREYRIQHSEKDSIL